MGIDRNVDTKDSGSRMGKFFWLGGGNRCGRKIFLFSKGRHRVNGCGRLGGQFDDGEGVGERGQERNRGGGHSRGNRQDRGSGNKIGVVQAGHIVVCWWLGLREKEVREKRWWSVASYSRSKWTLHFWDPVLGPRSLLQLNIPSIRSGRTIGIRGPCGVRSVLFHILLLLQ